MKALVLIKKNIPLVYRTLVDIRNYLYKFSRRSFSQFGEDLVLFNFIDRNSLGFYVDIGAFHPYKFSNTYFFYRRGWRGLNIDARPGSMKIFDKKRKRDINLEIGIADNEKQSIFYVFEDYAYNTFSKKIADNWQEKGNKLKKIIQVKTEKLAKILDEYLPQGTKISFMSIDVEGLDLVVLQSNDWSRYCPTCVLVEAHDFDFKNIGQSEIYNFLTAKGYRLVSIIYITLIFKLND